MTPEDSDYMKRRDIAFALDGVRLLEHSRPPTPEELRQLDEEREAEAEEDARGESCESHEDCRCRRCIP